jgi:heat shock protein HslJ
MNRVMGFTFFLLLLAAIALISLKDMRPIADSSASTVITGIDWQLISIDETAVETNAGLSIRFEPDGKISGHGGCNSFFSSYTMHESAIDIGPVGATRMACPEPQMQLEQLYFDVLDNASTAEVRGARMRLADGDNKTLAVFVDKASTQ